MNDCRPVRRTFWYPIFLPMAVWGVLILPVVTVREGLPLSACFGGLSVYMLLGALFQILIGLPLLSLFNRARRLWSRVWLAGFAAMLLSTPLSVIAGGYLQLLAMSLPPFIAGAAYTHYRNRQPSSKSTVPSIDPTVVLVVLGIFLSGAAICRLILILQKPGITTTSLDPWSATTIFLPTATLGFLAWGARAHRWAALLACTIGLTGMSLLFYLDHSNKYLNYLEWMHRSQEGLLEGQTRT